MATSRVQRSFSGTERYELKRRLGAGGMGVVYEAFDRARGELVALKTLNEFDAEAIYRIKQEFRALSGVNHPNLVGLHELVHHDGHWFFTMERVQGLELLEYVEERAETARIREPMGGSEEETETQRSSVESNVDTREYTLTALRQATPVPPTASLVAPSVPGAEADVPPPVRKPSASPSKRRVSHERLRAALIQIGEGLRAIHEANRLHRDIKPSNVLVTEEGRAVILDFGLATELYDAFLIRSTQQGLVCGTIAYMSPEQSAGVPLTPASDYYSIGVMIFEALTGELPFSGQLYHVVVEKQRSDAPRIDTLVPDAPADLVELTALLLSRDPAVRPTGRAFLELLGAEESPSYSGLVPIEGLETSLSGTRFVGRAQELAALERAYEDARVGQGAVIEISGPPGIGKTALLKHFVSERMAEKHAAVLMGRCYERELVPFKAVDAFMDALARYLRRLTYAEAASLVPPEARMLVRLFPVLGRVPALSQLPSQSVSSTSTEQSKEGAAPAERRRQAFKALRELAKRLSRRQPLIIAIDDVQHGDIDSGQLLAAVMKPPEPPPVLLILVHRGLPGPLLDAMAKAGTFRAALPARKHIELGPLAEDEATSLATVLLGRNLAPVESFGALPETAALIARESRGNPQLLYELASYDLAAGTDGESQIAFANVTERRLARAALERVRALPHDARILLEVLALSTRPLPVSVVNAAAGLPSYDRVVATLLISRRMARLQSVTPEVTSPGRESSTPRDAETIEVLHERVRSTVLGDLSADMARAHHMAIARVLTQRPKVAPESLVYHLEQSGQTREAAEQAALAAATASEALAFDRAAHLYGLALELGAKDKQTRVPLLTAYAEALANAGRGLEAAEAYLLGASEAGKDAALELERRAGEQLLVSGHVDRGLSVLERVLKAVGLRLPKDARAAVRATAVFRGILWLRGLHVELKDPSKIAPELLRKIDVCLTLATGLALVDSLRSAYFATRALGLALAAGDAERLVRALPFEVVLVETVDPNANRSKEAMRALRFAARRYETPRARALVAFSEGLSAYMSGDFATAKVELERAYLISRFDVVGARWEMETSQFMGLVTLSYIGELETLAQRAEDVKADAADRLSLFSSTILAVSHMVNRYLLALDRPADVRTGVDAAIRAWTQRSFSLEHFMASMSLAEADLYQGLGKEAYAGLIAHKSDLDGSMLMRLELLRVEMLDTRARAALGSAAAGGPFEERIKEALDLAKLLEASPIVHARALALMLRAQVTEKKKKPARPLYEQAIAILKRGSLGVHELMLRRRLAIISDDGPARREADDMLLARGVRSPESYARLLLPLVSR